MIGRIPSSMHCIEILLAYGGYPFLARHRLLADSIISSGEPDVSGTPQQAVTWPSTPPTVAKEIARA